tara:strand:+ start:169 stop:654 length:486 start_codon:yes stop_codon:yes gene_type:complete
MKKNKIASLFLSSGIGFASLLNSSYAGTHQAVCSFYTNYQPCRVTISNTHIEANLPTDYLYVDESNFLDLIVYEDLSKTSNLVVGTVTTLILGPIGLLGFLVKKKSGTVDYGVSFENDRGRKKTAFIRFKNMKAAGEMAKELPALLQNIAGEELRNPDSLY